MFYVWVSRSEMRYVSFLWVTAGYYSYRSELISLLVE